MISIMSRTIVRPLARGRIKDSELRLESSNFFEWARRELEMSLLEIAIEVAAELGHCTPQTYANWEKAQASAPTEAFLAVAAILKRNCGKRVGIDSQGRIRCA